MDAPVVTTKTQKKNGKKFPVIHVLMPDGRVTEFKSLAIVVPEGDNPDGLLDVFAVLINRDGVPYVTPDGNLAMVPCQPFALSITRDPDKLITLAQIATRASCSLSTVKRAVADGALKGKMQTGERSVRFRVEDVEAWLRDHREFTVIA